MLVLFSYRPNLMKSGLKISVTSVTTKNLYLYVPYRFTVSLVTQEIMSEHITFLSRYGNMSLRRLVSINLKTETLRLVSNKASDYKQDRRLTYFELIYFQVSSHKSFSSLKSGSLNLMLSSENGILAKRNLMSRVLPLEFA